MVKIQLANGYLDVKEGTVCPLNYGVADIRDISRRSGAFSKTITLAGTKNNHTLLNNYYDVNIVEGTFNIDTLTPCQVIQNGIPIGEDFYLQLISVNKLQKTDAHEEKVEYSVLLKDTQADFFTRLDNTELTDLDFTDLNHAYSATNVVASFNNTVADGYVYPLTLTSGVNVPLNEFKPAIYAKLYWDRIHAGAGVQYEWSSLSDCLFDKAIIPYNGGGNAVDNTDYIVEANVAKTIDGYQSAGTNVPFNEVITGWTETLDIQSLFDPVTGEYTSPFYVTSGQDITYQITFDYEVRLNNATGGNVFLVDMNSSPSTVGYTYQPSLFLLNNAASIGSWNTFGVTGNNISYTRTEGVLANGVTTIGSNVVTLNIAASNLVTADTLTLSSVMNIYDSPLLSTTNVRWKTTNSPSGVDALVDVQLVINSITIKVVPSSNILFTGATIRPQDYIPKQIKQKDFVKSICQMYNLFAEPDAFNPDKIIYKHRDDYYDSGAAKDWTYKLAKDRDQQLQFLPELSAKKISITYKADKDSPNVSYLDATNENYGQIDFTFDNEYIKGKEVQELIFSPTPMAYNSFGAVVPQYVGSVPDINIRILLHNGVKTCNAYNVIDFTVAPPLITPIVYGELGVTTYPMVSHFDDHFAPNFDINFGICDYYYYDGINVTNNNLFNLYWRRTIGQINDGKMLTAYFDLKENDIQKLRLNDKIRIDNSWWNINRVMDYDANSDSLTKVELLSVDEEIDLPPFRRRPFIIKDPKVFKENVINQFINANNVNKSEGDFIVKGIGNVVQEGLKGFAEGDFKYYDLDGVYTNSKTSIANFANTDLTFDANRSHDTAGYDLLITTDAGLYTEGYLFISPTFVQVGCETAWTEYSGNEVTNYANNNAGFKVNNNGALFPRSITTNYESKSATYTVTESDYLINCTANTFTITLPTALNIEGRTYIIKNSGSGLITVDGDGTETIDGATTRTLIQYESIKIASDGTNWIII